MSYRTFEISRAIERLAVAPFMPGQWLEALKHLGGATGSSFAQLGGWTGPGHLMHLTWNEPDGIVKKWLELGGSDPAINPVIRAGMHTPELQSISDIEIVSLSERKKLAIWGELYEPYCLPHMCLTPIWRDGSAHLVLVVLRSESEGVIKPDERKAFSAIARRCRDAALLSEAIGKEGARLLSGAFDALAVAAFALDGFGRVVALSQRAEHLVQAANVLQVKNGKLRLVNSRGADLLGNAVSACLVLDSPPPPPVFLSVAGPEGILLSLRISQLPRDHIDIGLRARAVVVVEETTRPVMQPELAVKLTATEKEIALAMLQGKRPAEIGQSRGVSVHTVRSQIRSIFLKTDVSSQAEFVAKARF